MNLKLLDLFCGAGGAARGYHDAGFLVLGIDHQPQPRFPYGFVRASWEAGLERFGPEADVIHASPPCQRWSPLTWSPSMHPDLIGPVREALGALGKPYIIENVDMAPLRDPVMLCGEMFGLGVFRHRLFEASFPLPQPRHPEHSGKVGDGKFFTVAGHGGGNDARRGVLHGTADDWRQAMGIPWMLKRELSQAIPPAYARWIGEQLQACLSTQP